MTHNLLELITSNFMINLVDSQNELECYHLSEQIHNLLEIVADQLIPNEQTFSGKLGMNINTFKSHS